MTKLQEFYEKRVSGSSDRDFLQHVGHTEYGRPITPQQYDRMVEQLHHLLDLGTGDRLLDLGCGNGVITARLAETAASVVGIDISPQLIQVARTHQERANITYLQGDLRTLAEIPRLSEKRFSRVLMHAALQHFTPGEFEPLLRSILALCGPNPVIVFGFIPEDGKQKHLFNTLQRRLTRLWLRMTGHDNFGHWWRKAALSQTCTRLGLDCSFHAIDGLLMAASYRFDMRIPAKP